MVSRKIRTERVNEKSQGEGGFKHNIFKGKYEAELQFPVEWGGG